MISVTCIPCQLAAISVVVVRWLAAGSLVGRVLENGLETFEGGICVCVLDTDHHGIARGGLIAFHGATVEGGERDADETARTLGVKPGGAGGALPAELWPSLAQMRRPEGP